MMKKMRKPFLIVFSFAMVFMMLFSSCSNKDNSEEDKEVKVTVSGTLPPELPEVIVSDYIQPVSFYQYSLLGLETKGNAQDQLDDLFEQSPAYSISKRFYSGEDVNYEDEFKIIKDAQNLYIKLLYKDVPSYNESKNKQHTILLKEAEGNGSIYTLSVVYEQKWAVGFNYNGSTRGAIVGAATQINDMEDGYEALVKIPLKELPIDPKKLQCNILRFDWGANPATSYFPIENSYFNDYSNNAVSVTIFLGKQGRMVDMKFTDDVLDFQKEQPKIQVDCIGVNKQQITITGESFDYELSWRSPQGTVTRLNARQKRENDSDILIFEHPPISEEGMYRIRLGNEVDTDLYIEKRKLVESANKRFKKQIPEKEDVDISKISDRGKLLLDITPPHIGIKNIPDPKDTGLRPYGLYSYSIVNPHQIKSNKTGDLYPNNEFPEDKVLRFDNGNGKIIEYPYYEDADGVICYFTPSVWAHQKEYLVTSLPEFAGIDPSGAAHVLAKLCENYEDYAPSLDYFYTNYPVPKISGPPYGYFGGLWNRWFYADLNSVACIAEAYAQVCKTNALEKLGEQLNRDLHKEIMDMIYDGIDYANSYGIIDGNMDYTLWQGLIRIGKALQEPDYIHYALERIDTFVKNNYLFDGFWREVTVSYHAQITNGLYQVLSLVTRYSDPEGYVYPGTGKRLDNFKFLEHYPILRTSYEIPGLLSFPNGKHLTVQDTWGGGKNQARKEVFNDLLMSASGIARLTGNTDALGMTGTQTIMTYVPKYGHSHYDILNMHLHAYGVELLPDLGYTHTYNRAWTISTLAHNTVTVNKRNSQSKDGGSTLRYVPSDNSVGVMRAFDKAAYSDVDVYDREVVFVPMAKTGPEGYVLDIFRVSGGSTHEYSLNMTADYDYELTTDVRWQYQSDTMLPEGVKYTKPTGESESGNASGHYTAYMFVKDVQWAQLKDQPYKISYYITEEGLNKNTGLNILGTNSTGELLMGKVPSMRATRKATVYDLNDQADAYQMDKMVLRREGENLSSCFVTLMEPFSDRYKAYVTNVEKLSVKGLHEFDAVVKVTGEGFTDYIFSAFEEDIQVNVDNINFKGQFGYVRIQNNKATLMQSLNADVLSYDGADVPENRSVLGEIIDVLIKSEGDNMNGFVVDTKPEEDLKGQYVIVKHPDHTYTGYKIKSILSYEGAYFIDIGDLEPGFDFVGKNKTKMMYYPHKEREGVTRFMIDDTGLVRTE